MKAIVPHTCTPKPGRPVRPLHRVRGPVLVRSSEPSVVFTSLIHASTPRLSDWCSVDVTEDPDTRYAIEPFVGRAEDPSGTLWAHSIRTQVHGLAGGGLPRYAAWVTHSWRSSNPAPAAMRKATSLAQKAGCIVAQERLRREHP